MNSAAISVTTPVGQAIERVKLILFRPFDAAKWFTIGFCAWLASLGRAGYQFNYNRSNGINRGQLHDTAERIHDYVLGHLYWIVPAAAALVLLFLAVLVVLTWLNSRGAFMFLHCVAGNRAEVAEPWRQYRAEGNSLFWFRLVLALAGLAVFLPLMALAGFRLFSMALQDAWNFPGIWELVGFGLTLMSAALVFGIVRVLTDDFVVPVMALRRHACLEGWREVGRLLGDHPAQFLLYLLFQFVLAIAIVAIVVLVVLLTCCLAGCLLVIPYLGTVLLLPILVFRRAYSLHYLAQYGPQFDVFAPPAAPPPTAPVAPPAL